MWLSTLNYRLRQVRQQLGFVAPLSAGDYAEVMRHLPASALPLFRTMSPADQQHSLRVCRGLLTRGCQDEDMLAAALLHDVGKAAGRVPFWTRPVIVLAKQLAPALLKRLVVYPGIEDVSVGAQFIAPSPHPKTNEGVPVGAQFIAPSPSLTSSVFGWGEGAMNCAPTDASGEGAMNCAPTDASGEGAMNCAPTDASGEGAMNCAPTDTSGEGAMNCAPTASIPRWRRALSYAWYHAEVGAELAASAGLSERAVLYIRTHHQPNGPAAVLHEVDEVS